MISGFFSFIFSIVLWLLFYLFIATVFMVLIGKLSIGGTSRHSQWQNNANTKYNQKKPNKITKKDAQEFSDSYFKNR